MPIFKKEERTTLKTQAFNQIREAIKTGKLKPGDRLIETELAKQMGISRFPVREAISGLEREGLVVTRPFKGSYVSEFDEKDLEELYCLRMALEELAIGLLMKKITDREVKELKSVFREMEKAVNKKKRDLISEDLRFHRTICELSGNRRLLEMWLSLSDQIRSFITMEQRSYKSVDHLPETHRIILEAIVNGNSRLAQKRIRENIENGLHVLKEALKERKKKG